MIVTFFFSFSHCSAGEDSQCSRKCPTPNVSEVSAVPGTVWTKLGVYMAFLWWFHFAGSLTRLKVPASFLYQLPIWEFVGVFCVSTARAACFDDYKSYRTYDN